METSSRELKVRKVGKDSHSLEDFFINSLKDIYDAETSITREFPEIIESTTSTKLKKAFVHHHSETKEQIQKLEQIFQKLGITPEVIKCEGMDGLLKEAKTIIKHTDKYSAVRDIGLIVAVQKVEHYEIASYGCMIEYAKILGWHDILENLIENLEEGRVTDNILTELARYEINNNAEREEVWTDAQEKF